MDNVNLADFKTVMGEDGNMWGGNGIIWLFAFLLFGGFGNWGGNRGNSATTEDLASGFNFSALQNKGNEILAAIQGTNQNISNAVCQLGYQSLEHTAGLGSKIDNCCCTTQRAIDGVKFDMANYASALQVAMMQGDQKILDKLCNMELAQEQRENANLRSRVQQLENREYVSAATAGIPRINTDAYGVRLYQSCCQPCAPCNPCGAVM